MNWHIDTVPAERLSSLLARIRGVGGTIACSRPGTDGVRVTWTTTSPLVDSDASRLTSRQ